MEGKQELCSQNVVQFKGHCQSEENDGPETDATPPASGKEKTEKEVSIDTIQTSHDNISVTLLNHGCNIFSAKSFFQVWCETTSGETIGKFNEYHNRHVIEKLQPNTDYVVNLVKRAPIRVVANYSVRTLFCSHPVKFKVVYSSNGILHLSWKAPLLRDRKLEITAYHIQVREYITENLVEEHTFKPSETKWDFKPNPAYSYSFTLWASSGELVGQRVETEYMKLKHKLIKDGECRVVRESQRRPVYVLNVKEITRQGGMVVEKALSNSDFGSSVNNEKVILLVGETGSGKTTWINAFINYLFDIKITDDFRFKIIEESNNNDETQSKTQQITIYRLYYQTGMTSGCNVTLIDTPGFGDTRGRARDEELEHEIHTLFNQRNGCIDYINAVGLVTGPPPRLTQTQKYIANSVLSLFGKDLEENLILLTTHSPVKRPTTIALFAAQNIQIKATYFFESIEVLNTKYYTGGSNQGINYNAWDNTIEYFRHLLQDLEKFTSKSVIQTQNVLDKRDRIKFHVSRLREYIAYGVKLLEQLKAEEDYVRSSENGDTRRHIIRRIEQKRTKNSHGSRNIYCQKCDFQCHTDCPRHEHVEHCIAMDISHTPPRCKICPNKCPWNKHKSVNFSVQPTIKDMIADEKYIANRYAGPGEQLTKAELCEQLRNDFNGTSCRVKSSISEIYNALKALQDIALLAWPKSQIDYIDQIIQDEEREMQDGYLRRIELLRQFRNEAAEFESTDCDNFALYRENMNKAIANGENVTHPLVLAKIWRNVISVIPTWKRTEVT